MDISRPCAGSARSLLAQRSGLKAPAWAAGPPKVETRPCRTTPDKDSYSDLIGLLAAWRPPALSFFLLDSDLWLGTKLFAITTIHIARQDIFNGSVLVLVFCKIKNLLCCANKMPLIKRIPAVALAPRRGAVGLYAPGGPAAQAGILECRGGG